MADASLERAVAAVEGAAGRLQNASQELNQIHSGIEERLRAAGVGMEVWLKDPVPDGGAVQHQIGYAKVDGHWRLAVRLFTPGQEKSTADAARLTQATRRLRERALPCLPLLLEAISSKLGREADRLESSLRAFAK